MRKLCYILPFISLLFLMSCEKNQAPQVINIQSLTDIVVGGSEVIIEVDANDTDEDVITYSWSADGGEFISSIDSTLVIWKAPLSITDASFDITVEIADGEFTVTETLVVTVEGAKFIDLRDDNIYEYVEIGTQTWMAENLAYLPSVSDSDVGSTDEPYYYVFDYEGTNITEAKATDNYDTYGVLFNWEAAKSACPERWHLSSDEEWKTLEIYLGMNSSDADDNGWERDSGNVGIKLKSTSGWDDYGSGDNSSGFAALPGGGRYTMTWGNFGNYAHFWSSTEKRYPYAWCRYLNSYFDGVGRTTQN
ncbi:fibrobacter succinogenes major paralogous domain-containing protein, partial [Bacteroidota bacterium]